MARSIQDYNGGTEAIDSDYPNGDLKDGPLGTIFDKTAYSDIHQFFHRLMDLASVTHNSLPDNNYNSYQFIEAARKIFGNPGEVLNYTSVASALEIPTGVTNPIVLCATGLSSGGNVRMPDMTADDEFDSSTIRVVNKSANTVTLFPAASTSQEIDFSALGYSLLAGDSISLTYNKQDLNWVTH